MYIESNCGILLVRMKVMDHYTYWKEGVGESKTQGKAEIVLQMLRENVSITIDL